MNEFLTIKLSSNPTDPMPWLVWSPSLQEVIASGELANREQLGELVDYSSQRTIIALLPSSDVLITPIQIPSGAGRQLTSMLPFLMEDELAQDIEHMHFSVIKKQGDQATVATVEQQYLTDWINDFQSHGMTLKKVLPDCLALPLKENHISAMHINHQWLMRKSDVKGAAIDDDWLEVFLTSGWLKPDGDALHFDSLLQDNDVTQAESNEGQEPPEHSEMLSTEDLVAEAQSSVEALIHPESNDEQATIYSYSELPEQHHELPGKWVSAPKELEMLTLAQGAIQSQANLLTGPFKAQSSWFAHLRVWRKVAIAASILLLLLLVQQTVQVQQIEAQTQAYRVESERIFRSVFPDRQRIPTVSYLKRLMQDEENALSGSGSNATSLLGWIAKLPPALQSVKSITIQSIQFDGTRQEIRLNAQSDDFQSFERLRVELSKQFDVSQGQLNKNGDRVQGNYVIKNKSTGSGA